MAHCAVARPRAPFNNPLGPINKAANAAVARSVVERIYRHRAPPGSPQWRTFAETEVRLALDAAASVRSPIVGAL